MRMSDSLQDWLARLQHRHPTAIELGLERVRAVAERMHLPKPAGCVITVGGTNGKGSTVAFIEAIARAAGLRVGAYTSPHLLRYNERVRIDGVDAGDAGLVAAFEAVEAARGDISLTYFETGTLAALWLFAREKLDLAILEVGLGGRLDAVNIIDPDVAVITTVDLDHMDWLGEDREDIGVEKAGIARAWKPLVLGDDEPPSSVLRHAYAIGASALRMGCDFFVDRAVDVDDASVGWQWREPGFILDLPMPELAAPVQLRNAATAIAALRASPLEIPGAAWARGIACARLPGRLQRLDGGEIEYRLDVGHNPQAAQALAEWLRNQPKQGRVHAVYAALADKDVEGVTAALASLVDHWHLAGLDVEGRAQDAEALAARVRLPGATLNADVATALRRVQAIAAPGDRVLVFGSFHTVEAALHALHSAGCREVGSPAPV
ncbi:MAG: bifunctional tetrahydrofolate synthase/dihydrofolate synthase [Xanthomonadales bacterium]|nr:bifunctional tetrahydrofolate synthase/dihydrofolate synthase [Xanthomonadales bacterium]